MSIKRAVVWMFSIILMALASLVSGQDYPNRPIRLLAASPGGNGDFAARLIAQAIAGPLGQQVIVDNRTGIHARESVSKAPPDGYTLCVEGSSLWLAPLLQKMSYDPVKDFAPISMLVTSPNILVVHPSVPAKSVKELIDLAKAKPGALNYASGGPGSSTHLAAELFKAMAGINIVRINYKGSGPAGAALVAGEVELLFSNAAAAAPHVKSGRLRALAVTSAAPSALVPGLPTMAATVPGYESAGATGLFAPPGTPAAIISRVNREVVKVLNQTDVKEKFFNVGVETVGSSPKEFSAAIESEMARMGKVIKEAGIRTD